MSPIYSKSKSAVIVVIPPRIRVYMAVGGYQFFSQISWLFHARLKNETIKHISDRLNHHIFVWLFAQARVCVKVRRDLTFLCNLYILTV